MMNSLIINCQNLKVIEIVTKNEDWKNCLLDKTNSYLSFKPYPSWLGQVEINGKENGHG